MKIINFLPDLLAALERWKTMPSEKDFAAYMRPQEKWVKPMLEDFESRSSGGFYAAVRGLNWEVYRADALALDPQAEEKRVLRHIRAVETLLGMPLQGEVVLLGAFTAMDGYARFDQGCHRVYLGVDESHGRGSYLDILIPHELTHVLRESLPEVWAGFGLTPRMSHDAFVENLPVVEHLMNEGFSCVVSECVTTSDEPWLYAYQTEDSLASVLTHGPAVDRVVHDTLRDPEGHYGHLYDTCNYQPEVPRYAHYVWAWQWVKQLLRDTAGGNPQKLLHTCSKELIDNALNFKLPRSL